MEKLWQIARKINMDPARILQSEPMAKHTSFGIGGPADYFLKINSVSELARIMKALNDEGESFFLLGGGANILVGDRGIRAWVLDIREVSGSGLRPQKNSADRPLLFAGAGISIDGLCEEALALELEGLENFYGMPGSLGGAIYMNARCYEKDISEFLSSLEAISPQGELHILDPFSQTWTYKRSPFQPGGAWEGFIVTGASFSLCKGDALAIASVMRSRKADRVSKGHYRYPSAGSMFKNDRAFGKPTGAILDSLGFKGRRRGDAAVSPWHANIFVNLGKASASDMRLLIEDAQEAAFKAYGFRLEPEVLFVGEF